MRGLASAMIDISDGLLADGVHMASASSVGLAIDADKLPLSTALVSAFGVDEAQTLALTAGDDYELLFTAPAKYQKDIADISVALNLPMTVIGEVVADQGVVVEGNVSAKLNTNGYTHF